jgi:prepilin-type N-terminal cleavage/methylation domain-containing protein
LAIDKETIMTREPWRSGRGDIVARGMTLIELLVVMAVIALLMSLLLPALAKARKAGRATVCLTNQAQMARASASYCVDFQDRIFGFSWKAHSNNGVAVDDPCGTGLLNAGDDLQAACNQAVYIIRTRGDRTNAELQPVNTWIPHIYYSQLALMDYLAARLPEPMLVCPEDYWRRKWQDIRAYQRQEFLPNQLPPNGRGACAPYISSYESAPCTFHDSPVGRRVEQDSPSFCRFLVPQDSILHGRKLADVSAPGNKVMLIESFDRHTGPREMFFALPWARGTLAFFDGSAGARRTERANAGWVPNLPQSPDPTLMLYNPAAGTCYPGVPDPWNPAGDPVVGRYRWTRGGLKGVDFGGTEVRGNAN